MAYETEEEQVEKIKDMWRRHGMPLLTGVAIALAGVFGWQAWNNYQDTQARNASTLYQAKDFAVAEQSLREVMDGSKNATLQEVARQRLARVLGEEQRAEEALELFSTPVEGAELRATREEIRGDLLLTLGRGDEAREAYKAAKEALEDASARPQLQLKLDDLAEEA